MPRICRALASAAVLVTAAACVPEPQPRTTADFLDDPIGLEATLARCNADRTRTLRDPECQNAREAAHRISVAEEEERLRKLEARSQRKLEELRALQRAADEARLRAEEAERRAEEAELLQQLIEGGDGAPAGAAPDADGMPADGTPDGGEQDARSGEG
jgi:hypothetical protein